MSNIKTINVVLTSSDYYASYSTVTIYSILKNLSPEYKIKFHIISYDISEKNKKIIEQLKSYKDFEITYIILNSNDINLPIPKQTRVNNIAYARLLVGSLLKDETRCIVMDSDLVFNADISQLWSIDLEDKIIGLVKDPLLRNDPSGKRWWEYYDISEEYAYTNTGVILIDLDKWRNNDIEKQIFENFVKYENILNFYDQDIIFITCHAHTKYLDDRWNYLPNIYYSSPTLKEYLNDISYVYHFGGPSKPWIKSEVEMGYIWWQYARHTPYYEIILQRMLKVNPNLEPVRKLTAELKDAFKYRQNILKYWRYKLLAKIMFGKKKEHYSNKKQVWKEKIRAGKLLRGEK